MTDDSPTVAAWRQSQPGDAIRSANTVFIVTEVVDGHVWGHTEPRWIEWECCRVCGIIRRKDMANKPCKGLARISLR